MSQHKTVLVTGGTGFIGSHVAELLCERNYRVRCMYRTGSNLRWINGKHYDTFESLFNDSESLKDAVTGVDYVYHIGGLIAAKNLDEFLIANRDSTKFVLEAVKKYAPNVKRFIYISSQAVTGPADSLDKPLNEESPCHPITSYAKSKLAGEQEVLKNKSQLPVTIIRPPAVYGPRDTGIYSMFKSAHIGLNPIMGYSKKYISLIHIYDLVKGIVNAGESEKALGNTYYITSDEFYTWDDIVNALKNEIKKKVQITVRVPHFLVLSIAGLNGLIGKLYTKPPVFNYEKGVDFIQKYWICSNEKAKRDFGFKPEISLEEGVKNTYRWYLENKWL